MRITTVVGFCAGGALVSAACYENGYRYFGNAFIAIGILLFIVAILMYLDSGGKPK